MIASQWSGHHDQAKASTAPTLTPSGSAQHAQATAMQKGQRA